MITTFYLPTRIIFGNGSIEQLGEEAKTIGQKAMVVTYPDIRGVGLLDKVIDDLKSKRLEHLVFDKVEPNPRSSTVAEAASIVRSEKVDLLIGLGGGSAMDAAKAIALASSSTRPLWHYVEHQAGVENEVPSIVQVPTLAGTGSEINPGAVITNWETHQKAGVGRPELAAKVAIVDPDLTLTVPKKQTARGGVDIFCHLVEPYLIHETALPVNDGIREALMRVVVKYLPQALARLDDVEARTELSWASTIAMSALSRLGGSFGRLTCHGIEHAVSGLYDIAHADGLAALLPAWMRNILPVRKERLDSLGKNVFGKSDGIMATEEWLESVGMKIRLRELGCRLEDANEIADIALKTFPAFDFHPVTMDKANIAEIYKNAS